MTKSEIEIVNNCSTTVVGVEYFVRRSVEALGYNLFEGISKIVLADQCQSNVAEPLGNAETDLLLPLAYYYFATPDELPFIELYLSEIYRGIAFPYYLSPLMLVRFSRVLAHEIAHHLVCKKGLKMNDAREELLADRYANNCLKALSKNRWYRVGNYFMKDLSGWHYAVACADYRHDSFEKAEDHFSVAWQLNPKNSLAADWYWQLRRRRSDSKD